MSRNLRESKPLLSVCIPTRDRREELLVAVGSCFAQTYRPLEVLVLDDASVDGTEAAVRTRFPDARFFQNQQRKGAAVLKNLGFREARGEFVVGLDDDSYYSSSDTLGQVVADFKSSGASVIALPFIEPRRQDTGLGPRFKQLERLARLRTFTGCAYAIRRETALELEGYRECFFYRVIDRDFSIRILDRRHEIVLGTAKPVVHMYSPDRDWEEMYRLSIRNTLLFDWFNIPHPFVFPRMLADAALMFRYKFIWPQLWARARWLAKGTREAFALTRLRRPVSREAYRRYRHLPAHGPIPWQGQPPKPAAVE